MKIDEYIKWCYKNKMFLNRKFLYRAMRIIIDEEEDEFIIRSKNDLFVYVDDVKHKLDDIKKDSPVLDISHQLEVDKDSVGIVSGKIKTTVGLLLSNQIMVDYTFNGDMQYINKPFTTRTLEKIIESNFVNDSEKTEDNYSPLDRSRLSEADLFIEDLANIIVVSTGPQTIHPHLGLEAFKKKTLDDLKKKYGDSLFSEEKHYIEFNKIMQKYDREQLKDDPSLGIVTSNKIIGQSRAKIYGSFGYEKNPFNENTPGKMILKPLNEGYDTSKEALPYYFNSSRAGSLFRGIATQESGATAKSLIGAAISMKYVKADCNTKKTIRTFIENGDDYKNRFIMVGAKPKLFDDLKQFEGKYVDLRDPMTCVLGRTEVCTVCAGTNVEDVPNATILQFVIIGGALLNADMKKMHGKDLILITVDLNK